MSAKRETHASEASEMRARSAKPEGAKRPSSPAGLAGRSAERACKLVYIIKEGLSVCLCVCMYPSSAHSFGPIGMKLGMDTPWDPGSDMG